MVVSIVPILLFVIPLFFVIGKSLVSLDNYVKFFSSPMYLKSLSNSLIIAVSSTVLIAPLALFIVSITRKHSSIKNIVKLLTSLPLVFSSYVFCIALIYIYGRTGFVNHLLGLIGLNWDTGQILYSMPGIIIANTLFFLPYLITPLYPAFEELEPVLEEAAMTLGSTGFRTFRSIVFPQISYGFWTGVLTTFLLVFNQISVVLALGAGRTYTLTYLLFAQYDGFNFDMASTIATISILITLMITFLFHVGLIKRSWKRISR